MQGVREETVREVKEKAEEMERSFREKGLSPPLPLLETLFLSHLLLNDP